MAEDVRSAKAQQDRVLSQVCVHLPRIELAKDRGITLPTVVNMRFVKPLDEALLMELAGDHEHVLTLEEHSLAGGFGSAIVEFVSDHGLEVAVERIGVPNNALVQHDSQPKQRALFGLTGEHVAARVASVLVAPVRP